MANYEGKQSILGAAGKGAATGAIAGTAIEPGIGSVIGAVGGAIVGGVGTAIHNHKMKKLDKERKAAEAARPTLATPQGILDNQAMYANMAGTTRVPGQDQIQNQIANSASSAILQGQYNGSSLDQINNLTGKVNQQTLGAQNDLGIAGAEYQMANKDKLAGARLQTADSDLNNFDFNKNQPYEYNLMRNRALAGQQIQNYNQANQQWTNLAGMAVMGGGGFGGGDGGTGWGIKGWGNRGGQQVPAHLRG